MTLEGCSPGLASAVKQESAVSHRGSGKSVRVVWYCRCRVDVFHEFLRGIDHVYCARCVICVIAIWKFQGAWPPTGILPDLIKHRQYGRPESLYRCAMILFVDDSSEVFFLQRS